ncbi:MAG: acetylxylan esterase [Bryobacteraceae bacterium]
MKLLAAVLLFGIACVSAQTPQPDPFFRWLDQIAQRQLDQRDKAIAGIKTKADADKRKQIVRKQLLQSIGGLPTYSGPLNARITGRLERGSYLIEMVIFESLPGFYVTGNLYRPKQAGRYPAVLVPAGHTQEGKPEPQILAANLAMKGFVALTYDPIGQGEREQTYLRELGRPLSGGGGNEHIESGVRSLLIGESVARYFIFDAKRAVDYLISRPDVDADRLGVAGCSGGGAIATYVGVFDPRMKAAASACYISSFRFLFPGPTADPEMSLPSFVANGLDVADFLEVAVPLPWLLLSTTEDYFTPAAARPVYEEARQWYGLYGADDKIQHFIGQGPHGTPVESREAIYAWMIRWLKDGKGDAKEQPVKLYTNHELQVTASGHVDGEPRSRKLNQIILDDFQSSKRPRSVAELMTKLRSLEIASSGPPPTMQVAAASEGADYRTEQIRFESEPGIPLSANLYIPHAAGRKPAVVIVQEKRLPVPLHVQPSPSTAPLADAMARAGRVVLELEPRDSPAQNEGRPFLGNWLTNERAELVGRNLPAMRAHDILRAVDLLSSRKDVDAASIRGYARGVKGFWMLLAAAVDPRIGKVWLDRTPASYQSAFEGLLSLNLFDAMIPGFALHWDFSDLVKAMSPRPVLWTDPTNWMDEPVFPGTAFRYRYVGEPDRVYIDEFLR